MRLAAASTLALAALGPGLAAQDSKPRPKSAPKVLLRYQFKKGDKGTYQMRTNMAQISPGKNKPTQSVTLKSYSWEVIEDGEKTVIEWSLDRIRQWTGKPGLFDGEWQNDTDEKGGFPGEMALRTLGEKTTFEIDSRGRIKNLSVEDKTERYLMQYEIRAQELVVHVKVGFVK